METCRIPAGYASPIDIRGTEIAIKEIKDFFERDLARELNLIRVSAPLMVREHSGLNDTLNGVERPVRFDLAEDLGENVEIVQSLAKWKRMALARYGFHPGEGLYTDMTAIRRDDDIDNIHSIYVDQWDWERIILREERTEETLRSLVQGVYASLKRTEGFVASCYEWAKPILPDQITFLTSQQLEDAYPTLAPKQREYAATKEHGAVFVSQIGGALASGERHGGRAPDYDDWSLNGDILVYYPLLDMELELSSMGIRVDEEALLRQLKICGCCERASLPFHAALMRGELPYTAGGGIGQSRMCMFFLNKAHIGEVHAAVWPKGTEEACAAAGVALL
ncbi:MAG: aspartate--ammonia ligase [Clostridia bacterium]|nr:aspartate--ammonia ligase [Clostridia bacterium]